MSNNNPKLSDNKLFRLIVISLFSGIIYACLSSVGGFVAIISLVVCLITGSASILIIYVQYYSQ